MNIWTAVDLLVVGCVCGGLVGGWVLQALTRCVNQHAYSLDWIVERLDRHAEINGEVASRLEKLEKKQELTDPCIQELTERIEELIQELTLRIEELETEALTGE